MQVNKPSGDVARTEATQRVHAPAPATPASSVAAEPESVSTPRPDDVHISAEGRALASTAAPDAAAPSDLDAVRANELRTKIFTGAYNALGMAEQTARAIIRSGDL